jgi:hypothetical protein
MGEINFKAFFRNRALKHLKTPIAPYAPKTDRKTSTRAGVLLRRASNSNGAS